MDKANTNLYFIEIDAHGVEQIKTNNYKNVTFYSHR